MAKKTQAVQEPVPAPNTTDPVQAETPISFEEPAAQLAEGAVISDEKPQGFVDPTPTISAEDMAELQRVAGLENQKRDFFLKVQAARNPEPAPVPDAAPIAPRIIEQTNAELTAGRAMVAKHEAAQALRAPLAPHPSEGSPVFRPADYVPNQKKGQGYTNARPV